MFDTTGAAYRATVEACLQGAYCAPRGVGCFELRNYKFEVANPSAAPIVTRDEERNLKIAAYTRAEFELYNSGEYRASEFAKHAKLWSRIANPDGTVNSAYGHLLWGKASCGKSKYAKHGPLTPWEYACCALKQDKDTRQAVLRFSLPSHQWFGNKDVVCTMHGLFSIRQEALHLDIVMRSNDVVKGLVYDMPWFCSLIERMRVDLASHYPELRVGTYTHFAHSMHLYESDVEVARRMI